MDRLFSHTFGDNLQNAESYRSNLSSHLEAEMATRTITTELNAHDNQYELTETITVPPEAAHTEVVQSSSADQKSTSMKILSNFGITMLPEEEDKNPPLLQGGQTLSLTEAGKRLLSDTSPLKTIVTAPKPIVQIKQEPNLTPKIIRINGNNSVISSSPGQPKLIRLSNSQLSNLKLGNKIFKSRFSDF